MNLLKKIRLNGEIFLEYAFVSFEFHFESTENSSANEYIFTLPKDTVISDLKIIDKNGEILKGSVISLTHATAIYQGLPSVILRKVKDDTYILTLSIADFKNIKICVSSYVPTTNAQWIFPTTYKNCLLEAEFYAHNTEVISSQLKREDDRYYTNDMAVNDLKIRVLPKNKVNSAIGVKDIFGGKALCRIYDTCIELDDKNIFIVSSSQDSTTLFIKYRDTMPTDIFYTKNNEKRVARIEEKQIYKSFAPLSLVAGEILCRELNNELENCPPSKVNVIREELERVGIEYSILNSETALAIIGNGKRPQLMRVIIADKIGQTSKGEVLKTRDVEEAYIKSKHIAKLCLDKIIRSMHANGGIFTNGDIDINSQRYQTFVSLLAIYMSGKQTELKCFVDLATTFLGDYTHKGYGTKDFNNAEKIAKEIWGNMSDFYEGAPDLVTSARILCRSKGFFC